MFGVHQHSKEILLTKFIYLFCYRIEFVNQFETVPIRSHKDRAAAKKEDPHFGTSFEPNSMYKMLSKIRSETFKVEGRQEDAEEFLSCLLNGLHDEMIEVMKFSEDEGAADQLGALGETKANPTTDEEDWQVNYFNIERD